MNRDSDSPLDSGADAKRERWHAGRVMEAEDAAARLGFVPADSLAITDPYICPTCRALVPLRCTLFHHIWHENVTRQPVGMVPINER